MKIIVTGAAGTIGTAVADHLASVGFSVVGVDRVFKSGRAYPLRIANLLVREAAYEILAGADAVVHLANHPTSWGRDAQTIVNENVAMNTHVTQAAVELGIPKLVFASTIQVMTGDRRAEFRKEQPSVLAYLPLDSESPAIPENPYALSKHLTETMLRYYARNHGLSAVAIRFPFVFNHRWHFGGMGGIHQHYRLDEAFSFLEIEDAAGLVEAVLRTDLPGFRVYFPASHENFLNRPAGELAREFFPEVPLKVPADQLQSLIDTAVITRETGWSPRTHVFEKENPSV
ncbi:MAG: NAD(P)-dependent oxidoreductase [Opitutaceae bacterium]